VIEIALKDLIKTMKQDTVILGSMDRYLMTRPRKSNTYDEEETDGYSSAFHPSMLSKNDCIRAIVYSLLHSPKTNLQRSPKGERIFDNGHSWGHQIQGYLYDMGLLLGTWECVYCGNIWTDMDNPSPKNCPCCEHGFVGYVAGEGRWHDLIYREVAITGVSPSGDRKILGHADGLFMINNLKHFLEIKPIKARDRATKRPAVTLEPLT
jgi:hypothetical protein